MSERVGKNTERTTSAEGSEAIRVLLVEDEDSVRLTMQRWLSAKGFDVVTAASVKEAQEALSQEVDVVLLDFLLGDGTGHDVLRHAINLPRAPRFIVLSGAITVEAAHRVGRQGAVAVMSKPADLQTLAQVIVQTAQAELPSGEALIGQLGTTVYRDAVEAVKVTLVTSALERSGGSRSGAARLLGMTRQQLQKLIRRHHLSDVGVDSAPNPPAEG